MKRLMMTTLLILSTLGGAQSYEEMLNPYKTEEVSVCKMRKLANPAYGKTYESYKLPLPLFLAETFMNRSFGTLKASPADKAMEDLKQGYYSMTYNKGGSYVTVYFDTGAGRDATEICVVTP